MPPRRLLPSLRLPVGRADPAKEQSPPSPETVLLVHGLGRTSRSLSRLHRHLREAGYGVIDWSYPSARRRIEAHGVRLREALSALDGDPGILKIHLVGHSLGGILARHALTLGVPRKMGRVVMLAPPNRGSRLARRLAPVLGPWIAPLPQLSDDSWSAVNRLGVPRGVEIGVIAATGDGKVRVEDTHLPGEADHLLVPGTHTFIMNRAEVREEVVEFLRRGRFRKRARG